MLLLLQPGTPWIPGWEGRQGAVCCSVLRTQRLPCQMMGLLARLALPARTASSAHVWSMLTLCCACRLHS